MANIDALREHIVTDYLFGDDSKFSNDTSFLKASILDSTGMMELIGFIEKTYGIVIEDDELVPENLDTIDTISRFLDKKTGVLKTRHKTTSTRE